MGTRPFTNWTAAREGKAVDKDGKEIDGGKKMGALGALGYVLIPTSISGYATYATIATAGVATTVGVVKHKQAVEAARKAKQRRNYGLLAAGGLAAVATAGYFGKQAYDRKNAEDHEFATSSELADDAPVSGTPSGTTKASSGAQGKKRKRGKQTDKETPWLLIGFLIVLALAVVGGAVYYFFLVMNEEGSDGLPPP